MSRLPIRLRLTAIFVVAIAAVFTLVGAFLFLRTKQAIDDSIRASLGAHQVAVRAYAEARGRPVIPAGERFAQIVAPDGAVIAREPPGLHRLLSPAQARAAAAGVRVFELHERERYLAGPATVGGRRVVVVVGASLAQHERALEGLGGALFVGAPLALLLAGAVAYLVAGGALGPVEAMRRRAATISTADPGAQLPVSAVDDELRRLSVTLNAMLARIAGTAEQERRFIASASHELRTPLAALRTELALADRDTSDPAALRAAVQRSRHDVERLIALSESLLELAVADEGGGAPLQDVDVDALLADAVADARRAGAATERELRVTTASGLRVRADPIALGRALTNLVDNALVHGAGPVAVGASADGRDRVVLWVENDGGLDPAMAGGRAFERFARGAGTAGRRGAGLGLALVERIARRHGGEATLDADGDRVRATVRLPLGG